MLSSSLLPLRAIKEYRPAKYLVESHEHPFFHMMCVTSGSALVFCGGEWIEASTSDLILIAPYQTHMIYTVNGVNSIDLKFSYNADDTFARRLQAQSYWTWRANAATMSSLQTIMEEAQNKTPFDIEIISARIYVILNMILRDQETSRLLSVSPALNPVQDGQENSSLIHEAISYIDSHLTDDISVNSLAKQFGYSNTYFSTMFKKALGIPPQQYILLKKIDMAKKLIRQHQLSLSVISDSLHFCSVQAFTNAFKKYCGVSPTQYYKQNTDVAYINLTDSQLLPPDNSRDVELTLRKDLCFKINPSN